MPMLLEGTIVGIQGSQLYMNKFNWFNSGDTSLFPNDMSLRAAVTLGYDTAAPGTPTTGSFLDLLRSQFDTLGGLTQLYFRDVYNVNDFFATPLTGAGWAGLQAAATNLASMIAVSATSTRTRQDIRAGQKRLPSLQEGGVSGSDGLIAGSIIEDYQDVLDQLGDGLDIGVGVGFEFFANAIVGKERYTTGSGKDAYRYYLSPTTQFDHIAYPVTWSVNEYITTQNSRKRGRGR